LRWQAVAPIVIERLPCQAIQQFAAFDDQRLALPASANTSSIINVHLW
jgi:hypothetical protein